MNEMKLIFKENSIQFIEIGHYLSARNGKAKMVLAQGLKGDLFDDILINWGWHFDFMHLGFHGMHNRGLKMTILQH